MTRNIIVCDDEPARADDACQRLRQATDGVNDLSIEPVTKDELLSAIEILENRRTKARSGTGGGDDVQCVFDSADVAFLDYDLIYLPTELTGESVAYLARCYSRCGLIVVVNQVKRPNFDLTLRDHLESFADLNLNTRDLANTGLWRQPFVGYRPWAWPLLLDSLDRWRRRLAALDDKPLDEIRVLDALDLRGVEDRLARQTLAFLEGVSGYPDPTITQFVRDSGNGLGPKDAPHGDGSVARIAAARLGRWVDVLVLGGQDVLTDAPHMIAAYPQLLGSHPTMAEANETAVLEGVAPPFRRDELLPTPHIDVWGSRPAWIVDVLRSHDGLASTLNPSEQPAFGFVFCEDVSRFLPRDVARRFIADLPTPVPQRFVLDPEKQNTPPQGLAEMLGLTDAESVRAAFRDITYAPVWRFSQ